MGPDCVASKQHVVSKTSNAGHASMNIPRTCIHPLDHSELQANNRVATRKVKPEDLYIMCAHSCGCFHFWGCTTVSQWRWGDVSKSGIAHAVSISGGSRVCAAADSLRHPPHAQAQHAQQVFGYAEEGGIGPGPPFLLTCSRAQAYAVGGDRDVGVESWS